jgi:hypothetical protein
MNMFDRKSMPLATKADAERFRELDHKKKRKPTPEELKASDAFNKAKVMIESLRTWEVKHSFERGNFAEAYAQIVTLETQLELLKPYAKKLIGFKLTDHQPEENPNEDE